MAHEPLKSEAAETDGLIAALEAARDVKDVVGWRSGFAALDRALNGFSRGVYLLVGPAAVGKTAFAKQIADQAVRLNDIAALFFTFAETKDDLRVRTLARLSGLETREIRRGAGYLLHTYGTAKQPGADEPPVGWDKLKAVATESQSWLARLYLVECDLETTSEGIERQIAAAREAANTEQLLVVIDDAQRLGDRSLAIDARLPLVVERLSDLAVRLDLPLVATWPELDQDATARWAERAPGAVAVMVLRDDRSGDAFTRRLTLNIVKNHGGEKTKIAFDFTENLTLAREAAGKP
ncbi:MAG TPA: DnaB-like helicase C-terminal domain-containing protein [Candidatus Binatia bacterium]|jgi:replicative DNA helicase